MSQYRYQDHSQLGRLSRRDLLRISVGAALWSSAGCARSDIDGRETHGVRWVQDQLSSLSLEDKVGQLICISSSAGDIDSLIASGKATAVYFRGGMKPEEVVSLVNHYQGLAKVPVFIMGGVEAGMGQRVSGATILPSNMAIGATGSAEMARLAGRVTASEARALGVSWPGPTVCDVNTNPKNPIINTRSFGSSPELVARLSCALVTTLQEQGMVGWGNHFPGHGDTGEDSHEEMPVLEHERSRLEQVELVPFKALIKSGVKSFGTSHIWFPALEPEKLPATLSKKLLTNLLRVELGFPGVISSDSFAMQAIRQNFDIEEAVVLGFDAGLDMLLAYPDTERCHQALVRAIEGDPQREARLNESVKRMLELKTWVGLDQGRFVSTDQVQEKVGTSEHQNQALEIARKAVTLLKGKDFLDTLSDDSKLLFVITESPERRGGGSPQQELAGLLKASFPRARISLVSSPSTTEEQRRIIGEAKRAQRVVVGVFTRVRAYDPSSVEVAAGLAELVRELTDSAPTAVIGWGNPYVLAEFGTAEGLVCSYDDSPASLRAAVEVCAGKIQPTGKLPVELEI